MPHDLSPWGMFLAADMVVKSVMVGLVCASVVIWTIWLGKVTSLWRAKRQLRTDLMAISGLASTDMAIQRLPRSSFARSTARVFLQAAVEERRGVGAQDRTLGERMKSRLIDVETTVAGNLRAGMAILATVGAAAPFIGLFGTVWGIMNSFIGISKTQTTNLAVVAPGIAEALLATTIGLFAAIPAVILYNHLGRSIASVRTLLRQTSHEVERITLREADHLAHPRNRVVLAQAAE